MADRPRLRIQSGIRPPLQFLYHARKAQRMIFDPRAQPTPDIASARDGGEIMELIEQTAACKTLQNTQPKRGAANPAPLTSKAPRV